MFGRFKTSGGQKCAADNTYTGADGAPIPVAVGGAAPSAAVDGFTNPTTNDVRALLHGNYSNGQWYRATIGAGGDAQSNPSNPLEVQGHALVYNGLTRDRLRVPAIWKPQSTVAIGAIATVWTPAAGKKFRLMGMIISVSAAVSVLFEDNGAGTTIVQLPVLAANTPYQFTFGNGILSAAANNVLKATSSGAANLIGTIYGTEE